MSNNSEIIRVRQLISECAPDVFKRCPVLFSYLYGSYARGDVHPFSDIDIGIYIETSIPEKTLNIELSLGLEFDDVIGGGCNVDVRSINNMPLMMKGKIVTEGLLLYSRDDLLRVEFETNVRKTYFDFKPYILRYQKAYLGNAAAGT
jgi:predicted nucleotidyltransferase